MQAPPVPGSPLPEPSDEDVALRAEQLRRLAHEAQETMRECMETRAQAERARDNFARALQQARESLANCARPTEPPAN